MKKKNKKEDFSECCYIASILENALAGWGVITAGEGTVRVG